MRKALLVGINHYKNHPLSGCVADAKRMENILSEHDGFIPNFDCSVLTSSPDLAITQALLNQNIRQFFQGEMELALFYFSGHGTLNEGGGFLLTQDTVAYDEGVDLASIIRLANQSRIREIIIILDCCHAGAIGNNQGYGPEIARLRKGLTILASSTSDQPSLEQYGQGSFTSAILSGLQGGAMDVLGKINVGYLYSYVDQLFGAWEQRPVLKTHISSTSTIRQCKPPIERTVLRKIIEHFKEPDSVHPLSKANEPTEKPRDAKAEKIFSELQKMAKVNLVIPLGEEHMYYAAIHGKSCVLTPLGKYYWQLVFDRKV